MALVSQPESGILDDSLIKDFHITCSRKRASNLLRRVASRPTADPSVLDTADLDAKDIFTPNDTSNCLVRGVKEMKTINTETHITDTHIKAQFAPVSRPVSNTESHAAYRPQVQISMIERPPEFIASSVQVDRFLQARGYVGYVGRVGYRNHDGHQDQHRHLRQRDQGDRSRDDYRSFDVKSILIPLYGQI